ncbi:MAG TPA: phospholipase D-like domain-containing protein [Chlamydiales bacterium]|nr:phospholipase D-like domain-containing protein [Chlamydiales bacterium]
MKQKIYLITVSLFSAIFLYLIISSYSLQKPSASTPPILYVNHYTTSLHRLLNSSIKAAKSSVFLAAYGLSDDQIKQSLKTLDHKKKKVTVYYDKRSSSKFSLNNNPVVGIKNTAPMHHKILTIDEKYVYIGSANITRSSLMMHENLMMGFYSPEIAKFLEKKAPTNHGHLSCFVGGQFTELFLLPDKEGVALNKLISLLKNAKKKIHVSMFTLTHPLIVDTLIEQKQKGINVIVGTDFHSSIGASAKAINKLKQHHISIYTHDKRSLFHYKHAVIDDHILISGSANWTKSAFQKNNDLLFILYSLTTSQLRSLKKIEKMIAYDLH